MEPLPNLLKGGRSLTEMLEYNKYRNFKEFIFLIIQGFAKHPKEQKASLFGV